MYGTGMMTPNKRPIKSARGFNVDLMDVFVGAQIALYY
jgi:hypothetical protein